MGLGAGRFGAKMAASSRAIFDTRTILDSGYFNYSTRIAESWWERRDFVQRWWRLNAADGRWTPPDYPLICQALVGRYSAAPQQDAQPAQIPSRDHVARQRPALVYVEALPGRPRGEGETMRMSPVLMEEPVAAAAVMADPRRHDRTAYLSLLSCANDEESLDRLLAVAQEQAWNLGCDRLMGPVGLSPYLSYGALMDHFHLSPPQYTPYNAPYLPDVLQSSLHAIHTTQLYHVHVHSALANYDTMRQTGADGGPAQLVPLDPMRLADDLLLLLAGVLGDDSHFPAPDAIEARFLLAWWSSAPLAGWLALMEGTPVGFVLVQPDQARLMRWTKGGRPLWRRGWLAWQRRTSRGRAGRILAGGVLPAWRGQGIGTQLWRQTIRQAAAQGRETLTVGPLDPTSEAAAFLHARGAVPQQRYTLYATEE